MNMIEINFERKYFTEVCDITGFAIYTAQDGCQRVKTCHKETLLEAVEFSIIFEGKAIPNHIDQVPWDILDEETMSGFSQWFEDSVKEMNLYRNGVFYMEPLKLKFCIEVSYDSEGNIISHSLIEKDLVNEQQQL